MDHAIMAMVFPEMTARKDAGLCPGCGGKITGFKDALSTKEFLITGMCQVCQDEAENFSEEE